METKKYIELQECFSSYLSKKGLRRTEERFAILECICDLKGHFDVYVLHRKMEETHSAPQGAFFYEKRSEIPKKVFDFLVFFKVASKSLFVSIPS